MLLRVLLLLTLTCRVCGVFNPHDTALKYQAEENSNITLEWHLSKSNISIHLLKIHCLFLRGQRIFYHLDNSVEEPQHEQFAGRVQCDRDALRAGRVRLHLSRVRTDDSGQYLCRMATELGKKVKEFWLNITRRFVLNVTSDGESSDPAAEGAKDTPEGPKKEQVRSKDWSKDKTVSGVTRGVILVTILIVLYVSTARCRGLFICGGKRDPDQDGSVHVELNTRTELNV